MNSADRISERMGGLRPRVGIALDPSCAADKILAASELSRDAVDVVVFEGPDSLTDMVAASVGREIGAVHKGSWDGVAAWNAFAKGWGIPGDPASFSLYEVPGDSPRLLANFPYDTTVVWDLEMRKKCCESASRFFQACGIDPKVGLLTAGKRSWIGSSKNPAIGETFVVADGLMEFLAERGLKAGIYDHRAELAIGDGVNVLMWPDSVSCNLGTRSLHFFGGFPLIGGVVVNDFCPYVEIQQTAGIEAYRTSLLLAGLLAVQRA